MSKNYLLLKIIFIDKIILNTAKNGKLNTHITVLNINFINLRTNVKIEGNNNNTIYPITNPNNTVEIITLIISIKN